jgi:sugar phosphate isomerase/epimerase
MAKTRTGEFSIGFRRGWSDWQKDLDAVIAFAKGAGFEAIDVGQLPRADLQKITAAGLKIGTIDLDWGGLAAVDAGKRTASVQKNADYIAGVADLCKNFFTVVIPEDHARARHENFKLAVDGYGKLCSAIAKHGAWVAIEGYPGGHPWSSSLACTPADYRAFLKEMPAGSCGINFDPSHLVRMGIDPVRFLGEFAPRVRHVHGKDTEIFPEELYEHGWEQPATFARGHGFGSTFWRYTIPGHGQVRWSACFATLKQAGFTGVVSIELEDENFNDGTPKGEQRGLTGGRDFLTAA